VKIRNKMQYKDQKQRQLLPLQIKKSEIHFYLITNKVLLIVKIKKIFWKNYQISINKTLLFRIIIT